MQLSELCVSLDRKHYRDCIEEWKISYRPSYALTIIAYTYLHVITRALLNCLIEFFIHLKLEFASANSSFKWMKKKILVITNIHLSNWIICITEHLSQTFIPIQWSFRLVWNELENVYIRYCIRTIFIAFSIDNHIKRQTLCVPDDTRLNPPSG